MSNAILEAFRAGSPAEQREAFAVMQREMNEPREKKKVPLPLDFQIADDEEVALDEHGFPVLSPELEEELARRAREPGPSLSVKDAMALLEVELQKQTRSR